MNKTKLNEMFTKTGVEVLISEAPQTRLWYTGIQTTDGLIAIEKDCATLFVDGRYIEYAQKYAKNVEVVLLTGDAIKKWFEAKNFKKIALEKEYLVKEVQDRILSWTQPQHIEWISGQQLRIQKDKNEIKLIQKAVDISMQALEELKQWIKPGMTEKEVAAKLNYLLKIHGAEKEGFEEIVASAENSAEPHHHPTDKKLVNNSLLKIDFGAQYQGYTADITRTFILGDEKLADPKQLEILQIVKESAAAGRKAVRPGIKASEIDKICRNYITAKGYGDYFVHSTGHGLGIDVHEFPIVSKSSDYVLEPGMILTVEPGIYIKGLGGARIEDDVLVTEDGHYVFSRPNEK
ncbi:Xaa-Pro aminopeptidase [Mycoplasmopsis mustelae]|uniref:Xaa-Pro aminopeptidase n=1 Tax=Mycoplasmopsis mustelae TaxID=171289 RepID=A0A4R7UFM6_9BACT|nr:M24 family metallopeptidase [Mycoplasmopsis mustelae]TDV24425.1 Xaa-Pro aminopeptidase [Mycoplasmopsis mustelae]